MKSRTTIDSKQSNKRTTLKKLFTGSALVVGGGVVLPSAWVKPVVNTVLLPAHAVCSISCDTTLSLGSKSVPTFCSGVSLPVARFAIEVSAGCGGIVINGIDSVLPTGASVVSTVSIGASVAPGGAFTLEVHGYPIDSAATCNAVGAGSTAISYYCDGLPGEVKSLSIDVLAELTT